MPSPPTRKTHGSLVSPTLFFGEIHSWAAGFTCFFSKSFQTSMWTNATLSP
jgi:hypothetical protein